MKRHTTAQKKLHPVVHLHLFNSKGELYLQKRPSWKDIQPGKWDTACGGHVDYGETIEKALQREVSEELGIVGYKPKHVTNYIFESDKEKEFVNVYYTIFNGTIKPSPTELDGGKFWTINEITQNIGHNIFTPNFENEFKTIILPLLTFLTPRPENDTTQWQ